MPTRNRVAPSAIGGSTRGRDLSAYVTLSVIVTGVIVAALRAEREPVSPADDALRLALMTAVDPNTATAAELAVLPGVGDALAARIVAFRTERRNGDPTGPVFRCAEDLRNVRGIGPKSAEKMRPFVRFHE